MQAHDHCVGIELRLYANQQARTRADLPYLEVSTVGHWISKHVHIDSASFFIGLDINLMQPQVCSTANNGKKKLHLDRIHSSYSSKKYYYHDQIKDL
jgi:hypothetical protein